MPSKSTGLPAPRTRTIPLSNALNPESFRPFGEVIQNPATHAGKPELDTVEANQGSATKWLDVTHMENWYHMAPSGKFGKAVMNMFVCRPRELDQGRYFGVKVLERHPFTPQTFVPMGMGEEDRYLVIVAPTLKSDMNKTRGDREKPYPAEYRRPKKTLKERLLGASPNPFTNDYSPSTTPPRSSLGPERKPKGPGEPDLDNLQAFIAKGDQAVTYGPGTWHAPMVVLGKNQVEFVVVQYANGVALEDCQEVDIPEGRIAVDVSADDAQASAPGIMRAKL